MDLDQLASEEPSDQDQHFFHSACKYILISGIQGILRQNIDHGGQASPDACDVSVLVIIYIINRL